MSKNERRMYPPDRQPWRHVPTAALHGYTERDAIAHIIERLTQDRDHEWEMFMRAMFWRSPLLGGRLWEKARYYLERWEAYCTHLDKARAVQRFMHNVYAGYELDETEVDTDAQPSPHGDAQEETD